MLNPTSTAQDDDIFAEVDALIANVEAKQAAQRAEQTEANLRNQARAIIEQADDDAEYGRYDAEGSDWRKTQRGGYWRPGYATSQRADEIPANVAPCDSGGGFKVIRGDAPAYYLGVAESAVEGIMRVIRADREGNPPQARPIMPKNAATAWKPNKANDGLTRRHEGKQMFIKIAKNGKYFFGAGGHDGIYGWYDRIDQCEQAADQWAARGFR